MPFIAKTKSLSELYIIIVFELFHPSATGPRDILTLNSILNTLDRLHLLFNSSISENAFIFYVSTFVKSDLFSFFFSVYIIAFKFFFAAFIIINSFSLSFTILLAVFSLFVSICIKTIFFSMLYSVLKINKVISPIIKKESNLPMALSIFKIALYESRIVNCYSSPKS